MIHVEESALKSPLVAHLEKLGREYTVISDIHEVPDAKSEIILRHKRDMYCRPCPATKIYRCCNYYTTDVMEGCPYDCSYCILQAYLGHKNIIVSADTDSIVADIKALATQGVRRRLGTGELSDSLALDGLFPFSKIIAPVINAQDVIKFEFKTKSTNIKNLLELNPRNIIVSWSLNPQAVVAAHEFGAAPVQERILAAKTCTEAGYKLAFHFDPIIYGYEAEYRKLLEQLTDEIPAQAVEYISLSTFRAPPKLIEKMRARANVPEMLRQDMIRGLDGKQRYFRPLREAMIGNVMSILKERWPNVFLYLCMEHPDVWQALFDMDPGEREELEALFPHHFHGNVNSLKSS